MTRSNLLNMLLALALVISALSLVTSQYRARRLTNSIEIAKGQADDLQDRKTTLEAKLAQRAQPGEISRKARKLLSLESLPADRTLHLTLRAGEGAARLAELQAERARPRGGR